MKNIFNLIEQYNNEFTNSDKIIALNIIDRPEFFLEYDIVEVSKKIAVSPPSITRFCKKIGLGGFKELKFLLLEEENINNKEVENIPNEVYNTYEDLLSEFSSNFNNKNYLKIARLISESRNIQVIGIGSSGFIARDFSIRLSRLGISSKAITDSDMMIMESQLSHKKDIFIAFSAKGITPAINESIIRCKKNKIPVILITENTSSALNLEVDVFIKLPQTNNFDPSISPNFTQLLVADTIINYLVRDKESYFVNYKNTLSIYKDLIKKR